MKKGRKIFAIMISAVLMVQCMGISVYARAVSENKTVQTIAPGVTLTRVDAFYSGYDLTYSYITADLSSEKVELSLLKSKKGINERDTVINLAKTEENVVAATNCDFFAMSSNSYSQGLEFKDGKILQSPIDTNSFAGGFLYEDNELVLSELDFHIMVVAPNLEYREVYRINKPMELYGLLLMYTSDYKDGYSPAAGDGVVEMIVENDLVVGFNRTKEPVKIPENGYVLAISEMDSFISANFKEGDSVKIERYITPTIENLKLAFGGGSMIVKEGKVCKFTNVASGKNPRTAIGIDKSGDIVTLLTVDGRSSKSAGLTQEALAELMIELGCETALNLDGGGSTQMVAKTWNTQGLETVNTPTENRAVINALGVKSLEAGSDKIANLMLEADKTTVYKGEEVALNLMAANSAYTRLFTDLSDAKYSTGLVSNGKFSSKQGGQFLIDAQIGEVVSNTVAIKVIDEISGILIQKKIEFEKAGEEKGIEISVFDSEGSVALVTGDKFDIEVEGECAEFQNGKVVAKSEGEAMLKVSLGDICAYSRIVVGKDAGEITLPSDKIKDEMQSEKSGGKEVVYTSMADEEKKLFDGLFAYKLSKILKDYDDVGVLGNQTHPALDEIYCVNYDKYMFKEKDGAAFISLPLKNGSVRSADSAAYDNLARDISKTKAENVFITADGAFNMSEREEKALNLLLAGSGKKIYVISKGEENNVKIINSVRYFTLADNHSYKNVLSGVKNLKMLKFNIDGSDVTYRFENIYDID